MLEYECVACARPTCECNFETVILDVDADGDGQHLFGDGIQRYRLAARLQGGFVDFFALVPPALAEDVLMNVFKSSVS
jgi:hypothetical protein